MTPTLIGQQQRLGHVVGHENGREAEAPPQLEERLLQAVAGERVQRTERLVEQHESRRHGQGARDADALLLPARQLGGRPGGELRIQLHQRQQLRHPRPQPFFLPARQAQRHGDVLADAHVREEADTLEDVADAATEPVRFQRGRVLAVHQHAAGAGRPPAG